MSFLKHDQALVHEDAQVGDGTRIWAFVNIQAGTVVGRECNICDGSFVERGAIIGDYVTIKHHVAVFNGVTIEDDVFIGSNVAFINDRHPRSHREDAWTLEKTVIKKGATLGSNSVILCGITIGAHAVIGAGSIVIKDIPAHTVVYGSPAGIKGYACHCGQKLSAELKCSCGKQYIDEGQGLRINE